MKKYQRKDRREVEPNPSKVQPNGRHKKPAPRYSVERWWKPFFSGRKGHWGQIAACRTLVEALHQMAKPLRQFRGLCNPVEVRIIDTVDGRVVQQCFLHDKTK